MILYTPIHPDATRTLWNGVDLHMSGTVLADNTLWGSDERILDNGLHF